MRDFSHRQYEDFLNSVIENNIPVYSVKGWIEEKPATGIILRHDVDRHPERSLQIAEMENRYKISTTYYFRAVGSSYNPEIMQKISRLGHEIGYHYEDLSLAKGRFKKGLELFQQNLDKLTAHVTIRTIAMHSRPYSRFDERMLWKVYNYRDFGLDEAYLSIDYSNIYYFTDSGRSWNSKANVRDYTSEGKEVPRGITHTSDLISFIRDHKQEPISINHHPERWCGTFSDYYRQLLFDKMVNIAKYVIILYRGRSKGNG